MWPTISIAEASPASEDAVKLIGELDEHLWTHPYPLQSRHAYSVEKLLREQVVFFVTHYEGQLAGCGGIKIFEGDYGEVKRMYVRPEFRGKGLGKAMIGHLADYARSRKLDLLRLETGVYEVEAIGLYLRCGFERVAPFGEYVEDPLSVYLEKRIA